MREKKSLIVLERNIVNSFLSENMEDVSLDKDSHDNNPCNVLNGNENGNFSIQQIYRVDTSADVRMRFRLEHWSCKS